MDQLLHDQLGVDLKVNYLSQCAALKKQLFRVLSEEARHCCYQVFMVLCLVLALQNPVDHCISKIFKQSHNLVTVDVFAPVDTGGLVCHPKEGVLEQSDQTGGVLGDALVILLAELLEGLVDEVEDATGEPEGDLVFRPLVLEKIEA